MSEHLEIRDFKSPSSNQHMFFMDHQCDDFEIGDIKELIELRDNINKILKELSK